MAHGSGGSLSHQLIEQIFANCYGNEVLAQGNDAAVLPSLAAAAGEQNRLLQPGERLAFSTDTYVVTPQFFPGGDIGRLAICGTVNDVSTSGAVPKWISLGFILEEGFGLGKLQHIATTIAATAAEANVQVVTGDTKVVERGHGDGVYINSSGVGIIPAGVNLGGANCQPGDKILLSGTLGDHGIAIIAAREQLGFSAPVFSDAAPLGQLVQNVLAAAPNTRCFRDPTRGGLASTLNELAAQSHAGMLVHENAVPVQDVVRGACDMLGYDVFQVANEGKMVAVVPAAQAAAALAAMQASPYGKNAAIIGEVLTPDTSEQTPDHISPAKAFIQTPYGSRRIMDMLVGEQLPRIC
jgi:hydrogenase expression/formation protein HypE